MSFNLETCRSKDELEKYTQAMFNVDLDKRKKLDELKAEVTALIAASLDKTPDDTPTIEAEPEVQFVKNTTTGTVFHYQSLLAKRLGVDLIPCDKDGNAL